MKPTTCFSEPNSILKPEPGLILGHCQTVQTQIRRRRTRRLIRACTVCWNSLKFRTIFPAYTQRQSTHQCCQYFDRNYNLIPRFCGHAYLLLAQKYAVLNYKCVNFYKFISETRLELLEWHFLCYTTVGRNIYYYCYYYFYFLFFYLFFFFFA